MNRPYTYESSNAKLNAQRNLWGRSHYVDDDTLRFFRARVLSSRHIQGGRLFYIIESTSADFHHTRRVFRGVVFDINGTVIYRPDLNESFRNSKQAAKAMWAFITMHNAAQAAA